MGYKLVTKYKQTYRQTDRQTDGDGLGLVIQNPKNYLIAKNVEISATSNYLRFVLDCKAFNRGFHHENLRENLLLTKSTKQNL